jgi:glycerol-3-phosphate O-acyltransferase
MTGAADRAAQNQARLEIQALGAKLQADQQVFNNLVNTSLDEQIRAIIDTQRQERDYMDARFRTLQAELLTTLIRQFSPRPIANPSLWQRVVALFTGRIQVLDRPYPSVNVGGDK